MKLFPHQIEDSKIMAEGDDIPNFSEAGTGKTLSTLEGIRLAKFNGGLIVGPTIALPMWKGALEDYLGAEAQILRTGKSPVRGNADFYVTSYGLASNRELRHRLMHWSDKRQDQVMVTDESQYIKTATSARAKAILGPASTGRSGLFEYFDQTWMLSGTPEVRFQDDYWTQLRATHPEVLRRYGILDFEDFQRYFCVMKMKQHHPRMRPTMQPVASMRQAELNHILYKEIGVIRRTMDEVKVHMPELTFRNIYVKISRDATLNAMMKDIAFDKIVDGGEPDSLTLKALRILGELKIAGCVDYILEQPHQVLVGYWNTEIGDRLETELRNIKNMSVARVMGGMTMDEKERIREAFNSGLIDVLVGQIGAMNTAWNLQESGHHVCILQDQFSAATIEQFVKRVWRIGQGNHVQVDFIKAEHPLDDMVQQVRESKAKSSKQTLKK